MSRKIPNDLKQRIVALSGNCCEYCRLPDQDYYYGFQIDHIISLKHGGKSDFLNLAYACPDCNRFRGSDLGTYLNNSFDFTRFFHPRMDVWYEHFELTSDGGIVSKTLIGEATLKIFLINHPDRIIERKILLDLGIMNINV